MASVPKIAKASVVKEAEAQWFNAQLKHNFKESNFWKAVANGCTIR
jgi:predicted acetyltransferase